MGWTSCYDTSKSARDHALDEWRGDPNFEVVTARGRYAAIKCLPTGTVFGTVILTNSTATQRAWKTVTEDMGPNDTQCPATVLNKLTDTGNGYALAWREACRKALRERVTKGDTFTLATPIGFSDGVERSTFTSLGRRRFADVMGRRVALPAYWRELEKTVG